MHPDGPSNPNGQHTPVNNQQQQPPAAVPNPIQPQIRNHTVHPAADVINRAPFNVAHNALVVPQPSVLIVHGNHPRVSLNDAELLDLVSELQDWITRANDRRILMNTIRPLRLSGTLEIVPSSPLSTWWLDNIVPQLELDFPILIRRTDDQDPLVRRLVRLSDLQMNTADFWTTLGTFNPELDLGRWEIIPDSQRHYPDRHQIQLTLRLPRSQAELVAAHMNNELLYSYPTRLRLIDPTNRPNQPRQATIGCRKRKNED